MSFTSLREKYIKDATHTTEQPANILDQLPSYNSYETNVFIDTLNVEYQEQLSLNKLLKDENIQQQSQKVKDFVKNNGWLNCKNNGKMRLEGKDYIVKDGDILNFRFNT